MGLCGNFTECWISDALISSKQKCILPLICCALCSSFFRDTLPFGSSSFDHDKVGYLSVEQALADYAVLLTDLKIQFKATESKAVVFGGRYIVT